MLMRPVKRHGSPTYPGVGELMELTGGRPRQYAHSYVFIMAVCGTERCSETAAAELCVPCSDTWWPVAVHGHDRGSVCIFSEDVASENFFWVARFVF